MGESIVRINLGSGNKIIPGFINVDMPGGNWSGEKPEVEADIFKPLPFPDNYADQILAIHVIEHCYVWETMGVLKEWKRILKPYGTLVLELPCLDKILYWFMQPDVGNQAGKTFWGLYGDPNYKDPAMCHRWAYTRAMMRSALIEAGFISIEEKPVQFHMPKRDMRFEAVKGES